MKKEIILGLLMAGLVVSPTVGLANESKPGSTTPEHRLGKPFQDVREEYREKIKDFRASTTETRKEARQDIKNATSAPERKMIRRSWIKDRLDLIVKRLNTAIDRSSKFIDRLTSLINQKEDEGKNVDTAKTKLDVAKDKVEDAEEAVKKIMPAVDNVLASSTISKDTSGAIHKVVNEAVTAVKEAHQAIVDVLKALKNN